MKSPSCSLLLALCVTCFCNVNSSVQAGGLRSIGRSGVSWQSVGGNPFRGHVLQKNTGLTTPKSLQRIAPYGLSVKNQPQAYSYQYSSPTNKSTKNSNSQYQRQQQQQRYQQEQRRRAEERQRQIQQQQRWQQQQRQMQQQQQQQYMREHQNIMQQGHNFQQQMMQNAINSLNRYTYQNQYNRGW